VEKKEKKEWSSSKLAWVIASIVVPVFCVFLAIWVQPKPTQDPFLPNPLLDQAELDLVEERFDDAIEKAKEVTANEPENPRPWFVIYSAHELLGRHDEAIQALQEGAEHIKRRDIGGKEIRAVLKAAKISREEGLAAVADFYRSYDNLKTLALRFLQLLVRVFEGADRFVRALSEVQEEVRLEAHTTVSAGVVPEETSTADEMKKAIDELEEAPISAEEYEKVKTALERPINSGVELISIFAADGDKLLRGMYNINDANYITYEEFIRTADGYSVRIRVNEVKKLSEDGTSKFISIYKNDRWDNRNDEVAILISNCRLPLDDAKAIYRVTMTLNENRNTSEETIYVTHINDSYKVVLIVDSNLLSGIS